MGGGGGGGVGSPRGEGGVGGGLWVLFTPPLLFSPPDFPPPRPHVAPRSRSPTILDGGGGGGGGSDFRSVECDDWKLEAPGVTEVSERVCVASPQSLIARRTEFIHETNRIRGDYDTGISQLLGSLGELAQFHS